MNDKTEKVAIQLKEALQSIQEEIIKSENGIETVDSLKQLKLIEGSITKMISIIDAGHIPPKTDRSFGLWRYILDVWPYDSEIRKKVVEAELAYDRL